MKPGRNVYNIMSREHSKIEEKKRKLEQQQQQKMASSPAACFEPYIYRVPP